MIAVKTPHNGREARGRGNPETEREGEEEDHKSGGGILPKILRQPSKSIFRQLRCLMIFFHMTGLRFLGTRGPRKKICYVTFLSHKAQAKSHLATLLRALNEI
jgi:hypothetical protein